MRKSDDGLSAITLCEYLKWDYGEVLAAAKVAELKPDRYLAQRSGWVLYCDFFYPPEPILLQSGFPMFKTPWGLQ
jgi:hypothetical protein